MVQDLLQTCRVAPCEMLRSDDFVVIYSENSRHHKLHGGGCTSLNLGKSSLDTNSQSTAQGKAHSEVVHRLNKATKVMYCSVVCDSIRQKNMKASLKTPPRERKCLPDETGQKDDACKLLFVQIICARFKNVILTTSESGNYRVLSLFQHSVCSRSVFKEDIHNK